MPDGIPGLCSNQDDNPTRVEKKEKISPIWGNEIGKQSQRYERQRVRLSLHLPGPQFGWKVLWHELFALTTRYLYLLTFQIFRMCWIFFSVLNVLYQFHWPRCWKSRIEYPPFWSAQQGLLYLNKHPFKTLLGVTLFLTNNAILLDNDNTGDFIARGFFHSTETCAILPGRIPHLSLFFPFTTIRVRG